MATVTTLQIKSTFYDLLGEQYSGTATGGSSIKLTDSGLIGYTSETWPTKVDGLQVRMTGGSASGDLRMVGRFDRSEGDVYPNRAFSASVANTDTYEFWGTAINGSTPLTTLLNTIMRELRPVTETQVTIVTNQNIYDLTTVVQSRRDIRNVYLRLLDPSSVAPYRVEELRHGIDWHAYDRGGAGTTSVVLELTGALTRDDTTLQMWIRGETGFTALSSDSSTVDAVYRDWLAWEAVLELSRRKVASDNSDKARWQKRLDLAAERVAVWRSQWQPREPIQVATF